MLSFLLRIFILIPKLFYKFTNFHRTINILFHKLACFHSSFQILFNSLCHFPSFVFDISHKLFLLFVFVLFKLLLSSPFLFLISSSHLLPCNFNLLSVFSKHFIHLILKISCPRICSFKPIVEVFLVVIRKFVRLSSILLMKFILLAFEHIINSFFSKFSILPTLLLLISFISISSLIILLLSVSIILLWSWRIWWAAALLSIIIIIPLSWLIW